MSENIIRMIKYANLQLGYIFRSYLEKQTIEDKYINNEVSLKLRFKKKKNVSVMFNKLTFIRHHLKGA